MSRGVIGARIPPMFETGEDYRINWLEGGEVSFSTFTVVAWEAPLLKVKQGDDQETIFNTASSAFLSAKPGKAEQSGYSLDYL